MNGRVMIRVYEVVGGPLCVASDDGQKLYDRISEAIKREVNVILSFKNIESLTSAFLNAAIGQLYAGDFSEDGFTEEQIKRQLSVEDMAQEDMALLQRVVETAKAYFKDPERFDQIRRETLAEDDEE